MQDDQVVRRRKVHTDPSSTALRSDEHQNDEIIPSYHRQDEGESHKLLLHESISILGIKYKTNIGSMVQNSYPEGLRGAILIELGFHKKIGLDRTRSSKRVSYLRPVVILDNTRTDNPILDDALEKITSCEEACSVVDWIQLLTGNTWNPFSLKYQMKNTRQRIAKCLSEKNACRCDVQNYLIANFDTYSLTNDTIHDQIFSKFRSFLMDSSMSNIEKLITLDPQSVALNFLIIGCTLHDDLMNQFSSGDCELADENLCKIMDIDYHKLSQAVIDSQNRHPNEKYSIDALDLMWAVISSFFRQI